MIINKEKKYIFIHIPRTSGTNLYECLSGKKYDESGLGHIFARNIRARHRSEFESYYTFTIVRNDYHRIYSWWFNRKYLKRNTNLSFNDWLFRFPPKPNDIHSNWDIKNCWRLQSQRTCQMEWITDNNGDIIVDHIVRYENLKEDLKKLGKIIGVSFWKMPRYGINNPKENKNKFNKNVYTPEMIEFMKKHHGKSIEYFGYEL